LWASVDWCLWRSNAVANNDCFIESGDHESFSQSWLSAYDDDIATGSTRFAGSA